MSFWSKIGFSGRTAIVGGRAVDKTTYAPTFNTDEAVYAAIDKTSGAILTTSVAGGDGAILDGVTSSIRATVTAANALKVVNPDLIVGTDNVGAGGQLDDVATVIPSENGYAVVRITPQRAAHINLRNQAGNEVGIGSAPLAVAGDVASGSTDSGSPNKVGGQARTTNPTAVTDGQRVNAMFDKVGRQVVVLDHVRDLIVDAYTIITTTTETTILAAVAGVFLDLETIMIANTALNDARVDFRDTTAGPVRFSIEITSGQTMFFTPNRHVKQTSVNTNWTAQLSQAATNIYIFAQAAKNI